MKTTMPRLIDDKRKHRMCVIAGVTALAITAVAVGYNAWMKSYRERRAMVAALIEDGEAELARLREDRTLGTGNRIPAAFEQLRNLDDLRAQLQTRMRGLPSLEIDSSVNIAEDRPKAEQLKSDYANTMETLNHALRDFGMATNRVGAITAKLRKFLPIQGDDTGEMAESNIEQCLQELARLRDQTRPGAVPTEQAIERFNKAYEGLASARASLAKAVAETSDSLAEVNAVSTAATKASSRVTEAANHIEEITRKTNDLRIDTSELQRKSQQMANMLTREAVQAETEIESLWRKATNAATQADATLSLAQRQMNESVEAIQSLLRDHGSFVSKAACDAVESAQKDLRGMAQSLRTGIASWSDAGTHGIEKRNLLAEVERMKTVAKALHDGKDAWNPRKVDSVSIRDLEAFRKGANTFIAATDNVAESVGKFVQSAQDAVSTAKIGLPDWDKEWRTITKERGMIREAMGKGMQDASRVEKALKDYQSADGSLSNLMEELRSACQDIEHISKEAVDPPKVTLGKALEKQKQANAALRLQSEEAKKRLATALDRVGKARTQGSLYKIAYVPGAVVWRGSQLGSPVASSTLPFELSSALSPTELSGHPMNNSVTWHFSLEIPTTSVHEVSVRIQKNKKPMNEEIQKLKSKAHNRSGGEIKIRTRLSNESNTLVDTFSTSFPNTGAPLKSTNPKYHVGTVTGEMPMGWQSFRFTVEPLETDPAPESANQAYSGWDYSVVSFVVYLDGKPVKEVYHKQRQ